MISDSLDSYSGSCQSKENVDQENVVDNTLVDGDALPSTSAAPQQVCDNQKIIELLGQNPFDQNKKGTAIHEELVARWSKYLTQGIPVETRKELILKYPIPENCAALQAPKMNEEIKNILPVQSTKNDTFFTNLQAQLAGGLTIIGSILTEKLASTPENIEDGLVQKLSDAALLFASVHHAVSVKRKWEVNPSLNQDSRAAAQRSTIDEYLFGSGFMEKVTSGQTMKKASENIRNKPLSGQYRQPTPTTSVTHNLNSRRHVFNTKMKGEKRKRDQWDSRTQRKRLPEKHNYRYQQRQSKTYK